MARTIGVAIDIGWPVKHHQALVRGVLEAARDRGWRCVLDPFLESRSYDGVILRATRELARRARRLPAVNVWVNSPDRSLPRVLPDQAAAGRLAAGHLLARGFRRFGFLGHPRDRNSRLQLDGFRSALAGRPCTAAWIRHEPRTASDWRRAERTVASWIAGWTLPCGVFAADDRDVARALRVIADRSAGPLRVPEIARAVALARRTLERRFRAALGRTVHDEIVRSRIERAKRLLVASREPLKRVALLAGFSTPQQFSRAFRRSVRATPLAFRRRQGTFIFN